MTAKLNQIVAVEKGLKSRTGTAVTAIYHDLQRGQLFTGFSKVYTPRDEEGDQLPPERQLVQLHVEEQLKTIADHLTRLFDVVATKDATNTTAFADVIVDGQTIVTGVTVPTLLFLEKQLMDVRTVISKLPITDPSEVWIHDEASGQYRTTPTETSRTRKVPRVLEKAPATERHPAQVEVYMVDETVGTWRTTRLSGAVHAVRRTELTERVNKLIDAVKTAVERANQADVTDVEVGDAIFRYLLRP